MFMGLGVMSILGAAGYFTYLDQQKTKQWMNMQLGLTPKPSNTTGGGQLPRGGGGLFGMFNRQRTDDAPLEEPLLQTAAVVAFIDGQNDSTRVVDVPADAGELAPVTPVTLTWQNVHFHVTRPDGTDLHILKGVSGAAGPLVPRTAAAATGSLASRGRLGSRTALAAPVAPSDGGAGDDWDAPHETGAAARGAGLSPFDPSTPKSGVGSQHGSRHGLDTSAENGHSSKTLTPHK